MGIAATLASCFLMALGAAIGSPSVGTIGLGMVFVAVAAFFTGIAFYIGEVTHAVRTLEVDGPNSFSSVG